MTLNKLDLKRPKRLLSMDGGGIRGLIVAEILIKLEDILCNQPNSPWKCLADYFDFIGGTSAGAILAAGLAKGMSARELRDIFYNDAQTMFSKRWLLGQLWSKYDSGPLEKNLKSILGDITLGSEQLKTLLMIVSKNVTTDETWFFINHPNNKNFNINSEIPLWHLVRASSAAPTFFPPHIFAIDNHQYEFVDGAVSMFNNPSFQLFVEATQKEYGIGWETGADNLLLISIGTGFSNQSIKLGEAKKYTLLNWAGYAIGDLMEDANVQQNVLMKLISDTPRSEQINRELSDVSVPSINGIQELETGSSNPETPRPQPVDDSNRKLLTYHRYTTSFTKKRFEQLKLPPNIDPNSVTSIDCVDQVEALSKIGQAVAEEQVSPKDFEKFKHEDY
jgi:hypothetical protein